MIFNDSWGFFSPAGSWSEGHYAWNSFSWVQWIGICFFIIIFSSLFIFKNFYKQLYARKKITITIGIIYISFYFIYYILNIVYFYTEFPNIVKNFGNFNIWKNNFNQLQPKIGNGNIGGPPNKLPQEFLPLELSSLGQILGGLLLITRNKRLFKCTFAIFMFIPFAAIIAPAKRFYGLNNYFYYEYFLNHTFMIVIYWWFFLYGVISYQYKYYKLSYVFLILYFLFIIGLNSLLNTNFMFVGNIGFQITNSISTSNILSSKYSGIWQSILCILILGTFLYFCTFWILFISKPLYIIRNKEIKNQFVPNKNYFFKDKKKIWKWQNFKNWSKSYFACNNNL